MGVNSVRGELANDAYCHMTVCQHAGGDAADRLFASETPVKPKYFSGVKNLAKKPDGLYLEGLIWMRYNSMTA